jgi:hypothetical protein
MPNQEPDGIRKPRSTRSVDRHESLHAQGEVFQLKYLAGKPEALLDGVDDIIAATKRRAPVRTKQPYPLFRDAPRPPCRNTPIAFARRSLPLLPTIGNTSLANKDRRGGCRRWPGTRLFV